MGWFKDRWRREGAGRPAPESGWRRVGVMGLTHFWKLIRVNLLFVLFSLPVLTLPAALTALDRVCVVIYKEGNIFLWDEFWKEFRRSFARTILPGLGFGLLLFGPAIATQRFFDTLNRVETELNRRDAQKRRMDE